MREMHQREDRDISERDINKSKFNHKLIIRETSKVKNQNLLYLKLLLLTQNEVEIQNHPPLDYCRKSTKKKITVFFLLAYVTRIDFFKDQLKKERKKKD